MADKPNVLWNYYLNPNKFREETLKVIGDDGNFEEHTHKVAGVPELGYVDPDTGVIVFNSDLKSDGDAPTGPAHAPFAEPSDEKREALDAVPGPDFPLADEGEE